jgi:TP901-1 family phage major tail protein
MIRTLVSAVMTTVAGMRTKSLSVNSEIVDVSDSGSTGEWRELLANAGIKTVAIKGSGVFKDSNAETALVALVLAGTIQAYEFVYPGLGTFSGSFQVSQCELAGEYKGEATFSFSFESAGVITFA